MKGTSPFILCLVLEIADDVFARILTKWRLLIDCDREKRGKRLLTNPDEIEFLFLALLHRVPCDLCNNIVRRQSSACRRCQSLPIQHSLVHHLTIIFSPLKVRIPWGCWYLMRTVYCKH